jgi:hypothetical protein
MLYPTLLKLPTLIMVRVLTCLNQIPIYPDKKELKEDDFERLGKLAGDKLWQSYTVRTRYNEPFGSWKKIVISKFISLI